MIILVQIAVNGLDLRFDFPGSFAFRVNNPGVTRFQRGGKALAVIGLVTAIVASQLIVISAERGPAVDIAAFAQLLIFLPGSVYADVHAIDFTLR